jgi:hypothetical protein
MHPYTKPALTVLVCLGLVLSGAAVGLPADGSAPGSVSTAAQSSASTGPATVSNDHLVLSVTGASDADAAGRFTLTTAADEPEGLLRDADSWLVVTVDGTTYTNGDRPGTELTQYLTDGPAVKGQAVVTEWTLPEGVVVTQTVALNGTTTDFDVTTANTGSDEHDLSVDLRFAHSGAVWLDGAVPRQTTVEDPTFDSWRTDSPLSLEPVVPELLLGTTPSAVTFGPEAGEYPARTSVLRYDHGTVGAGEEQAVSLRYGLGDGVRPDDRSRVSIAPDGSHDSEVSILRGLVLDEVLLTDGGWVGIYDDDGELQRVTDTWGPTSQGYLRPGPFVDLYLGGPLAAIIGESQEVTAVAFHDSDGDRIPEVPQNLSSLGETDDQPYVEDGEVLSDTQFVTVGQPPYVDAGPDQTVLSGEVVELEPGVIDGDYDSSTAEWTQTAGPSVDLGDATFPEFVAPDVEEPTTLSFRFRIDDRSNNTGSDVVNVTVEPRPPLSEATASVDLRPSPTDGRVVFVDSVSVSNGGFVTIHDESLVDGDAVGSVVGVSEYLPPGTHEDVAVRLFDVPGATYDRQFDRLEPGEHTLTAMVHLDSDRDEQYDFVTSGGEVDGPYQVDGEPVTATETGDVELYYQVDLVTGEPYERLGPAAENGFYADRDEDRLFRWAHGTGSDGLVDHGNAWATEELRTCVESESVERDPATNTASVELNVTDDCPRTSVTLTLAVYEKPAPGFSPSMNQTLVASTTVTVGPGTHVLEVELPEVESES